ncbi:MAG: hypothetical protein HC818_03095 [Synechococcaceae cyanobacterium RM1_1_27]|nr:hypothetical protein [Synechococcaceae cyanobacterium RM1_1_27]
MPFSPLSLNKKIPQARLSQFVARPSLEWANVTAQTLALGILLAPAGLLLVAGQAFGAENIPILEITITSEGVATGGTSQGNPEHPMLDFSLEESETAMAMFGCDCPHHLNQLRKLRGLPLLQDEADVFESI